MVGPLVDAVELARLGQPGPRRGPAVLDVRWQLGGPPGREAFEAGHVPGSAYVDLETDLADSPTDPPSGLGRHPLPSVARLQAALRRAGVDEARPVVVLDDWAGRAAARAWWLLRWAGHPDVRVLDGGWRMWTQAGGAVATGPGSPEPGDFTVRPGGMPILGAADVAATPVLLDAREPERFRGEVEPVDPVAGHIPGARNAPTSANLDADGRFRTTAALRATYGAVGALEGASVAVYCGSGVTATHDVLALELLGVSAALYPGSWSGWVSDPARPVSTDG